MFKKIKVVISAILSLFCLFKLSAERQVYQSEFQVKLTDDGKGCIITKCMDDRIGGVSTVPDTIEGLPVKEIGDEAFKNIKVSYIYLPNTLEKIGDSAFWGCENAETIYIPDSVTSIGRFAFCGTSSLQAVKFPSGKVEIQTCAFAKSGLRNLTITGNMTFVDVGGRLIDRNGEHYGFFYGCDNLETLTIEADVEKIPSPFVTSKTLKSVVFKSAETIVGSGSFKEDVGCPNLSLASQAAIRQHLKENNTAYQAKVKARQEEERSKLMADTEKAIIEYIDENGFSDIRRYLSPGESNEGFGFDSINPETIKEEVFNAMLSSGKLIEEEGGYYITPQKRKSLLAEAEKKIEEKVREDELLSMYSLQYHHLLGDNLEFLKEEALANVLNSGKICEVEIERYVEREGCCRETYLAIPGTYPLLLAKAENNILAYVQSCEKCSVNFPDDFYKKFDNATNILEDTALVNLLESGRLVKYNDKTDRNLYYATPEQYAEYVAKEKAEKEKLLADVENAIVEYVREHGPCQCNSQIDNIRIGYDYTTIEIDGKSYYVKEVALKNAVKSGRLVEYKTKSDSNSFYATPEKYEEYLAEEKAKKEKLLADVENAIVEYAREHGPCQYNSQVDNIRIGYDYTTIEIDGKSYYVKEVALKNAVKSGRLVEYKTESNRDSFYATPEKYVEHVAKEKAKKEAYKRVMLLEEAETEIRDFIIRNYGKSTKKAILSGLPSKYDSVKEEAFANFEKKGRIAPNKKGVYYLQ